MSTAQCIPGPQTRIWRLLCPLLAGVCLVIVGGCDNTIAPFSQKGTYAIHGYLGVNRDRQFIRVKPLPVPLANVDSASLDATVTLENVTDDTSVVLRDSTMVLRDSQTKIFAHNFWTDLPISPRTKYRLSVKGPYGSVQSTAVTPTGRPPEVTPRTGGCREEITVVFRDMKSLRRHQARVEVKPPNREWVRYLQRDSRRRGYKFDTFTTKEGWVAFTFIPENLVAGLPNLAPHLPELPPEKSSRCWDVNPCAGLKTTLMKIYYLYLGPEWYGAIPEDGLSYDPLQSYDVKGGLGFFGAVLRDRAPFRVKKTPKFYFVDRIGCQRPDA